MDQSKAAPLMAVDLLSPCELSEGFLARLVLFRLCGMPTLSDF